MAGDSAAIGIAALTAFVSTIAATPVRYMIDRQLMKQKHKIEFAYEQRRQLRDLTCKFRGRIVTEADALHQRLLELYRYQEQPWLHLEGNYDAAGGRRPYFFTTVYRFASFSALASKFERGTLYLDKNYVEPDDLDNLAYVRALVRVMTDVTLFDDTGYVFETGRDHLFRDEYRSMCEALLRGDADETELHYAEFTALLGGEHVLQMMLAFFDGISPHEGRLRWDRLVCFDLLLMGMLNTVGYDMQRSSIDDFHRVAGEIRNPTVAANLHKWLPTIGVSEGKSIECIDEALEAVVRRGPRTESQRAEHDDGPFSKVDLREPVPRQS
ncbi:MAG: hypothetical protein QOG53_1835 [Frankiales bacterium]|jgi:hypothetical protein|nr:hypothetical protein [Frankiales bacterium]